MFVLAFKTMDDREREVEFDGGDEAIARMDRHPLSRARIRACAR